MAINEETQRVPAPRRRARRLMLGGAATITAAACFAAAAVTATASASVRPAALTLPAGSYRRGELVSGTALQALGREAVDAKLTSDKFDPGTDRYGVRTYRLVYRTVDPEGQPTTASGLLVLPQSPATSLRTVSFAHGTENYKPDAPSTSDDGFLTDPAITYASAGFAAVAPDYLGLGLGPGTHPWMDVPSETTASLDMLRAARQFVAGTGRTLQRDVLVAGFSQGASAALGLARSLQGGADPRFQVRAVAPISGAYDFLGAELPALLDGQLNSRLSVAYTAYLLVAYNRLHHLYDSPDEVFLKPYAGIVDGLFDGTTPGEVMLGSLPDRVDKLLTPDGLTMLQHPTGALASALREADSVCVDWAPQVPVRLYFSHNDEEAANSNTAHCQAALRTHGVAAPAIDLGDDLDYNGFIHEGSEVLGTAASARWFASLR